MITYRLSRQRHASDLSGKGAEISGGRWNSKGVPMLYTSDSRALCTAEVAVHLSLGLVPFDYVMVTIEFPEKFLFVLPEENYPPDRKLFPYPSSTRSLGDAFIKAGKHLAMKVPSAVVEGDFNYLLNPSHDRFGEVKILRTEPFGFDKRFFRH